MTEKEKQAIEIVKRSIESDKKNRIVTIYDEKPLFRDVLQTLLNLIEKQEEEIDTHIETENDYEHELVRKDEEIEKLKKHYEMATRIIEGYADEVEKDTLKIENYRHKNIK